MRRIAALILPFLAALAAVATARAAVYLLADPAAAAPAPGSGDGLDIVSRLLQPGNLAASTLLAFNVAAFIKGWIVPAWVYKAEKARADRMEERAWKATEGLGEAIRAAEKTADAVLMHPSAREKGSGQ